MIYIRTRLLDDIGNLDGEFGRTPKINKDEGRDHFPSGWSMALAGGGVRGGQVIGQTDNEEDHRVKCRFRCICFALFCSWN